MDRKQIIQWAREAGMSFGLPPDARKEQVGVVLKRLERFAELIAAHERNKLAAWMIQFGFATGHGETMEELVDALGTEIVDRIDGEVVAEREACAKVSEEWDSDRADPREVAAAIRARSE